MDVKGIGSVYRRKLSKAAESSKGSLTPEHVCKSLNITRQEAGRLLSRWHKAGWLRKIKRGFYILIPVESSPDELSIENPWIIVSKLFEPGYIGGFSAIKHWDLSEQIFETITYFTTKNIKDRNPKYSGLKLQLKSIDKSKLFGTKTLWIESTKIQVSDPSKTLVDLLDDPSLVGGMRVVFDFFKTYFESEYKNMDLIIEYTLKMKNKTIFKRLGFLLELLSFSDEKVLNKIKINISKGYSNFDPAIKSVRIIKKWNLKIPNSWIAEYDRKK